MGVNNYILERRHVRLIVGGVEYSVGSLRRSWKTTELDSTRVVELEKFEKDARAAMCPSAAMLADVCDMPMASDGSALVKAHLVIGWDEGRVTVTDMGWDYLPILGYGVLDRATGSFVFYEEKDAELHSVGRTRAAEIGLVGSNGQLIRRGQPKITECRSVRLYIAGFAEADCTFENGSIEKVLISLTGEILPDPSWLVGKKPIEAGRYPPSDPRQLGSAIARPKDAN